MDAPFPVRPTTASLAERAYKAYATSTGGKTHDGRDMPQWSDLPQATRNAWHAAVEQVRHDVLVPIGTGA